MELLAKRLAGWDQASGAVSGGGFPVDDPAGLRAFLNPPPAAFIALETELWPNLLRELAAREIPRIIVNGRLTERSLTKAAHKLSITQPAVSNAMRRLREVVGDELMVRSQAEPTPRALALWPSVRCTGPANWPRAPSSDHRHIYLGWLWSMPLPPR
jgi:hypothetical protein